MVTLQKEVVIVANATQQRLLAVATKAAPRSTDPTRRKCFISYHAADVDEVEAFLDDFGDTFIPRVIGVTDGDDFVDSNNTDYVMDRIREEYLTDSTVTIVLIGQCTWARRYVDWEVYSTLRHDKNNRLSGLMAITLPSAANVSHRLPPRVDDNVDGENGYARWWKYPTSKESYHSSSRAKFARSTDILGAGAGPLAYGAAAALAYSRKVQQPDRTTGDKQARPGTCAAP